MFSIHSMMIGHLWLGLSTIANAEESASTETIIEAVEFVKQAREAIVQKDFASATSLLDKAEKSMVKSSIILEGKQISEIWYLRGAVVSLQGQDPLDHWRQALIINLGQEWDASLVPDEVAQDLYLALKSEIQNRRIVSLQIPEQYGQAKIYVDGFLRAPGDFVYQGQHFAQVQCPKGDVHGKWTNFEKTFNWLKLCPYKFDVTDMPEPVVTDEWDMFGGGFGGEDSAPDVNMSNQMVAPPLWERMDKTTLYSSAGTAALSTILYTVAAAKGKKFDDLDNGLSIDELSSLRSSTNTIAVSSCALGVLSCGLYLYSMSTAKID